MAPNQPLLVETWWRWALPEAKMGQPEAKTDHPGAILDQILVSKWAPESAQNQKPFSA